MVCDICNLSEDTEKIMEMNICDDCKRNMFKEEYVKSCMERFEKELDLTLSIRFDMKMSDKDLAYSIIKCHAGRVFCNKILDK